MTLPQDAQVTDSFPSSAATVPVQVWYTDTVMKVHGVGCGRRSRELWEECYKLLWEYCYIAGGAGWLAEQPPLNISSQQGPAF